MQHIWACPKCHAWASATTLHRATNEGCMLYIKSHHLHSPEVDIYTMQPDCAKVQQTKSRL